MTVTELPVISPRERQAGRCCTAAVEPDLSPDAADRLSAVAKALGDRTRMQLVDVLRKSAPEALCQCELVPLFEMSQPALAKHLKVLVAAGVLGTERRGLWTYYFVLPDAIEELTKWLT